MAGELSSSTHPSNPTGERADGDAIVVIPRSS
jgi:hypothetical protein